MGGARCSYRNCSQKSDQVTHMFHYPVFDKLRCHQWLTNAQKLNYLNLKVSQLKNRVVCQHHFTDDCFMNNLKKKLKNTAVPTKLGPYCTMTFDNSNDEFHSKEENELPINIDDIENEFLPKMEKKAHFSVKYGDFLTNDVPENITLTHNYNSSIKLQANGMVFNRFDKKCNMSNNFFYNQTSHSGNVRKIVSKPKNIMIKKNVHNSSFFEKKLPEPKVVSIEYEEFNLNPKEQDMIKIQEKSFNATQPQDMIKIQEKSFNAIPPQDMIKIQEKSFNATLPDSHSKIADANPVIILPSHQSNRKKVKIISEKHISEPLAIPKGEMQPISPSIIINMPHKKKKANIEVNGQEIPTIYIDSNNMNMAQLENAQLFDNNNGISSQEGYPLSLKDQTQTSTLDQITTLNNSQMFNETAVTDLKLMDYITSEAEQSSQLLNQDTTMLTNNEHTLRTAPNLEFVSSSLMGPSVFTLVDVPAVSTLETDPSYVPSASQAQNKTDNSLVRTDSRMLAPSPKAKTPRVTVTVNENQFKSKSGSPNKLVKNKMPPEKLAAIEEKRKYNMKLRDIINSCLSNMDDEPDLDKLTAKSKKELSDKKVAEHLAKDPNLPNSQENSIAYLETRLQRLEDNLVNKIEQNSQKITEIKKALKQNTTKKSVFTQTYQSAEATKRSLYEQLSKYLSSDTNSLIYEELFINTRLSKKETATKRKRR